LHGERFAPRPLTTAEFFKRTLIVVGVALVPVLVWYLFDVILIAIGAILIAVLLHLVAEPFVRCRLPQGVALILSGVLTIGAVAGAGYLFGTQIDAELQDLLRRASAGTGALTAQLQGSQIGKMLLEHIQGGGFSIPAFLGSFFSISVSFLEALVVTVIAGFYLAVQPQLYRNGFGKLFPQEWRANVNEAVDDIGRGLRLWLIGELIQMVLIGLLCMVAVWLIGLPSPLALGVIAGLAEFVPYLGPIVASIPAILVATTKGGDAVLWTVLAYAVIHQIEGNLVVPMIQRRMIFIPPAVMLLGLVTILFMFGGISAVFAGPIAVIVFIAIKKLYVRDALGEETSIPGEPR
jgi:predicted PurR-regulated permease PerM